VTVDRVADGFPAERAAGTSPFQALPTARRRVALDLDLLLTDLVGHLALLGDHVLVEADTLLGNDLLVHDDLLGLRTRTAVWTNGRRGGQPP